MYTQKEKIKERIENQDRGRERESKKERKSSRERERESQREKDLEREREKARQRKKFREIKRKRARKKRISRISSNTRAALTFSFSFFLSDSSFRQSLSIYVPFAFAFSGVISTVYEFECKFCSPRYAKTRSNESKKQLTQLEISRRITSGIVYGICF